MKWNNCFLLLLDNKEDILINANAWIAHYNIPPGNRYAPPNAPAPGFIPAEAGCLARITLLDKLIVVVHNVLNRQNVPRPYLAAYINNEPKRPVNANEFADWLFHLGLRNIGELALKSCFIGATEFPYTFINRLTERNINIGYLATYQTFASKSCHEIIPGVPIPMPTQFFTQANRNNGNYGFSEIPYDQKIGDNPYVLRLIGNCIVIPPHNTPDSAYLPGIIQ